MKWILIKKDKIKKETSIMKMFIDTANVDHIREANDLGVICGQRFR